MLLSAVVPCHNEEAGIERLIAEFFAALEPAGVELELVLVDDGSRDRTLEILRRRSAADSRIRYVAFSRNFGKEAAMLAGLAYARGDAVVILDADLQHPPDLVPDMLERYRQGYDQVVARRTREGDRPARATAARLYYKVVNRLVDVPLADGVGDFRLLSRRAVDALLTLGESNRFSKGLFSWIGFPLATVDYRNQARVGGTSKWTTKRLINYGIDGILSFNTAPLRGAIYLGAGVTVLFFGYVAYLLVAAALGGIDVPGYLTLITAVAGLGGMQLLFLGIIGEYVGRIYLEVKRRPHFVVAENSGAPLAPRHPEPPSPLAAGQEGGRAPERDGSVGEGGAR